MTETVGDLFLIHLTKKFKGVLVSDLDLKDEGTSSVSLFFQCCSHLFARLVSIIVTNAPVFRGLVTLHHSIKGKRASLRSDVK